MGKMPEMVHDPTDVVGLTQKLIQIPSYVKVCTEEGNLLPQEQRVDETDLSDYIYEFLKTHTRLQVKKQEILDGRFNVIAANSDQPKTIFLGHTDTVLPSVGSDYDQFSGEIHDGKIYGLGATDMKSGLASLLSATAMEHGAKDIMMAFYVDEEYDFAGMKKFADEFSYLRPELIVSADGGNLKIGHGCRGLVELHGTFLGKSAHAARPHMGVNAITGGMRALDHLEFFLKDYRNQVLGDCTVNTGVYNGGKAERDPETGMLRIVEQVNAVPDISIFKTDIRVTSPNLTADLLISVLNDHCVAKSLRLEDVKVYHDLGAWLTPKEEITDVFRRIEEVVRGVDFDDPKETGYLDLQMFWNVVGRPRALSFGSGNSGHQANEYVDIDALLKSRDVFRKLMSIS